MTAGITGQFAASQQVGAARCCGLTQLMCSPALRQGPSLNPHRHLGISLRAVPFSLVLCLTNSSPFSSLELYTLCLLSVRDSNSTWILPTLNCNRKVFCGRKLGRLLGSPHVFPISQGWQSWTADCSVPGKKSLIYSIFKVGG